MPPPRPARRAGSGRVSVLIPCEPGGSAGEALAALAGLSAGGRGRVGEVLLAFGRNPGAQRNAAAARARGDWLWCLDKDSRPDPGCLEALLRTAEARGADAVGGPDLVREGEGDFGRRCDAVLGSWLGCGPSRARYRAQGRSRPCTEKRLIGCNLLLRRAAWERAKGFREDLYPNEENELLERLRLEGACLWYEPGAPVRRARPATPRAFLSKAFGYGRGRGRQARVAWTWGSLLNFLPLALFAFWLGGLFFFPEFLGLSLGACALLGLEALGWGRGWSIGFWRRLSLRTLGRRAGMALLWHGAYALGLLAGLVLPRPALSKEVQVWRAEGVPDPVPFPGRFRFQKAEAA